MANRDNLLDRCINLHLNIPLECHGKHNIAENNFFEKLHLA